MPELILRFSIASSTCVFGVCLLIVSSPLLSRHALLADELGGWENAIAAFEQQDKKLPPRPGGLLFVGSSSIRGWNLTESFPDVEPINRGFGGSQMSDVIEYFDRIVIPYQPAVIVLYEGDNDIAAGKSADQVVADYKQLIAKINLALPETRVAFISIKPSIKRWQMYPAMKAANDQIQQLTEQDSRLEFIDVSKVMLGDDGKPLAELFLKDGLHLNPVGYARWAKLVRPHLRVRSTEDQ